MKSPVYAGGALLPSAAVAVAGLIWGVWWLPLRHLEASGLSGNWANVAIYAAALLFSAPFLLHERRKAGAGSRANLISALLIGLLSGVSLCIWNYALISGFVIRITLIWYLAPVWTTLLGMMVFGERLRPLRFLTIVFGLSGAAALLGIERTGALPLGLADGLAFLSSWLFSIMVVLSRKAGAGVGGWSKTFYASLFGGLLAVLLVAVVPSGGTPSAATFAAAGPAILFCMIWQVALTWLLLWGSGYLESGRVAIFLLLEVMGAVISAAILTSEPFGLWEIVGCILIAGAGLLEGIDEIRAARTVAPSAAS